MDIDQLQILLADDDKDDCLFFKEALEELPVHANLTTLHDGEQLMKLLTNEVRTQNLPACRTDFAFFPDVLFLDLNVPRKNGFACLSEIKRNYKLQQLPVIIFSTSFEPDMVTQVFNDAAHYYIRKPAEFSQLKNVIQQALTLISQKNISVPGKENFVLTSD